MDPCHNIQYINRVKSMFTFPTYRGSVPVYSSTTKNWFHTHPLFTRSWDAGPCPWPWAPEPVSALLVLTVSAGAQPKSLTSQRVMSSREAPRLQQGAMLVPPTCGGARHQIWRDEEKWGLPKDQPPRSSAVIKKFTKYSFSCYSSWRFPLIFRCLQTCVYCSQSSEKIWVQKYFLFFYNFKFTLSVPAFRSTVKFLVCPPLKACHGLQQY